MLAHVLANEFQSGAFAEELRSVHAAERIGRLAVTAADSQFDTGIVIRRPADRRIGIPAVVIGMHTAAVAVFIVLRVSVIGRDAEVTGGIAAAKVQRLVVAPP